MNIKCDFCDSIVSSKYVLKNHLLTNKSCLNIRNIEPSKKFICKGCDYMATDQQKFSLHCESCKSYQILLITEKLNKEHQDEIKEKNLTILNLKNQLDKHDNYYIEYIKLKVEHDKLTEQYEKTITKLELKISQCDTFIQTLARDGATKVTTTNNNTVNNIRNILSPTYTLDKLEPKKIEEKIREHYSEHDFFNGQKGLAGVCVDRIIKTPDGKMMICCSDISRKKFKILDVNGNLKEDIEARLFCQQLKVPIQTVTKEMYDKIAERIDKERERLSLDDRPRREKLLDDSMRAQQYFIDIMNFDDLNYNQEFMHELCVLLN